MDITQMSEGQIADAIARGDFARIEQITREPDTPQTPGLADYTSHVRRALESADRL